MKARKQAVALGYDPERDGAPKILASGQGFLAEAILKAARDRGIPVREDAALASSLARLEVGSEIPPELYQAVAEILAFLWHLEHAAHRVPGGKAAGTGAKQPGPGRAQSAPGKDLPAMRQNDKA